MKNSQKLVLFAFILIGSIASAQPGFDDTVEDVAPIPGLLIAAAAAIGIGVRSVYKKSK
ncbi:MULTISPECIES: hypothetical protein [Nonlabens]|uniref:hypothetical protein n=1 Tax=Nonlabens TaxID=363408 RepID=UPI0014289F64|nr:MULTISPECIES: hypothetical protein [Nonlabens]